MLTLIIEYGVDIPRTEIDKLRVEVATIVSKWFDGEFVEVVEENGTGLAILVEYTVQHNAYSSERDMGCMSAIADHVARFENMLSPFVDMVPITIAPTDLKNVIPAHINQIFY